LHKVSHIYKLWLIVPLASSHAVDFLLQKAIKKTGKKLKLDWAGGLKEYRDTYTSLELQRKNLEWWGD
jgi:hypothetical protein